MGVPKNPMKPAHSPNQELKLIQEYVGCRRALLKANLIRTYNDPIPEIAEYFVNSLVGGTLAKPATRGLDIRPKRWKGPPIQVKSLYIPEKNTVDACVIWLDKIKDYDVAVVRFDSFCPTRLMYIPKDLIDNAVKKSWAKIGTDKNTGKQYVAIKRAGFDKCGSIKKVDSIDKRPSSPTIFEIDLFSFFGKPRRKFNHETKDDG